MNERRVHLRHPDRGLAMCGRFLSTIPAGFVVDTAHASPPDATCRLCLRAQRRQILKTLGHDPDAVRAAKQQARSRALSRLRRAHRVEYEALVDDELVRLDTVARRIT